MKIDEALDHLGRDHVDWFRRQPATVRQNRINGAWQASDLRTLDAYQTIEHGCAPVLWYQIRRNSRLACGSA